MNKCFSVTINITRKNFSMAVKPNDWGIGVKCSGKIQEAKAGGLNKINHIHYEDIHFLNSLSTPAGVACT